MTDVDSNDPLAQPGLDLHLLGELQQLEEHLRSCGAYLAEALRPGLAAGEVTAFTGGIFDPVPAELLTWYAWHNGVEQAYGDDDPDAFLPNVMDVLSLDEAMNRREGLLRTSGPELDDEPWMTYQPTWLPLVASDKHYLVADLTAGAGHPVPVLYVAFPTDEDWNTVQEPSIAAMVAVWNTHFANGNYRWNREEKCWQNHPFFDKHHYNVA